MAAFDVVVVAAVRIGCGLFALEQSSIRNRDYSHAHGGDKATVLMNFSCEAVDSLVIDLIIAMTVKPAWQNKCVVILGVNLSIGEIWIDRQSEAAFDNLMKACCGDRYFA